MESSCQPTYQLKRIGKSATVPGVSDILILSHDITKFGRHSGNDHYLDSLELSYFISRWHAEVHFMQDDRGGRYVLRDTSLNGTYVNGIRVKGDRALKESDVVMFGHPHGKDIRPGQVATCITDSEFEFLFQKANHQVNASPVHLGAATYELAASPVIGQVNGSPDVTWLSQQTPTLHSRLSTVSRKILTPEIGGKFLLKNISNIRCTSPGQLLHLDQLFNAHVVATNDMSPSGAPHALSASADDGNDSEILRAAVQSAAMFGESDSEVDVLTSLSPSAKSPKADNGRYPWITSQLRQPITSQLCQPITSKLRQPITSQLRQPITSQLRQPITSQLRQPITSQLRQPTISTALEQPPFSHHSDGLQTTIYSSVTCPATEPAPHGSSKPTCPAVVNTSATQDKTLRLPQATVVMATSMAPLFGSPSSISNRENEKNTSVVTRKRKYKKRKLKFSRGRKGELSRRKSSKWHSDGEQCESYDCCRPDNDEISWVQCDDCDKWYHTVCAGCNYNTVKQHTTEFCCGCT